MARAKKKNRTGSVRINQRRESCCGCGKGVDLNLNDWVILATGEYMHNKQDCYRSRREKDYESIPSFDNL